MKEHFQSAHWHLVICLAWLLPFVSDLSKFQRSKPETMGCICFVFLRKKNKATKSFTVVYPETNPIWRAEWLKPKPQLIRFLEWFVSTSDTSCPRVCLASFFEKLQNVWAGGQMNQPASGESVYRRCTNNKQKKKKKRPGAQANSPGAPINKWRVVIC